MPFKDFGKYQEWAKEYRSKNKEKILKFQKAWKEKNPDKVAATTKKHYEKHREYYSAQNKKWAEEHPERRKELNRKYTRERRIKVLLYYSNGDLKCSCCGETEPNFLTLDHVNNDGYKTRRTLRGAKLYTWIIRNNYPATFQVLCYNCNCSKGFYGECPHETARKTSNGH